MKVLEPAFKPVNLKVLFVENCIVLLPEYLPCIDRVSLAAKVVAPLTLKLIKVWSIPAAPKGLPISEDKLTITEVPVVIVKLPPNAT